MLKLLVMTLLGSFVVYGSACSDEGKEQPEYDVGADVGGEVDDDASDVGGGEDVQVPEAYRDYIESDGQGGFLVSASGIPPTDGPSGEEDLNDPALVQWAVDNAVGRVALLADGGDFEFGDGGSVFIYTPDGASVPREVEIVGEWDVENDRPATRIVGGYRVLTVGMPPAEWAYTVDQDEGWATNEEPRPLGAARARIANIWFDRYDTIGIWLAATDEAVIEHNHFTDGLTRVWGAWDNIPTARGILIFTPDSWGNPTNMFPRLDPAELPDTRGGTAITGHIAIRDNTLDGNARVDETAESGLQGSTHLLFAWYFNADLEVSGNDVRNYGIVGLAMGGFFRSVVVRDNYVEPGPVGQNTGIACAEDGYSRAFFGTPFSEGDAGLAAATIVRNTFVMTGNPAAGGNAIMVLAGNQGVQISENHIDVGENPGVIGIHVSGYSKDNLIANNTIVGANMGPAIAITAGRSEASGNVVHNNHVEGTGVAGIILSAAETGIASGNTLSQNDFSELVVTRSQLEIGPFADGNVIVGNLFGGGGDAAVSAQNAQDNRLLRNEHHGDYPGWSSGSGLWSFDVDCTHNKVIEPGPDDLDTTDQFQDLGTENLFQMD